MLRSENTLIQRANREMGRNNFYAWYCSLSDEDRQELSEYLVKGVNQAIKTFSEVLSQLPDVMITIMNEFNVSVEKLSKAAKELEMNEVVK